MDLPSGNQTIGVFQGVFRPGAPSKVSWQAGFPDLKIPNDRVLITLDFHPAQLDQNYGGLPPGKLTVCYGKWP